MILCVSAQQHVWYYSKLFLLARKRLENVNIPRVLEWSLAHLRGFEPLTSASGGPLQ